MPYQVLNREFFLKQKILLPRSLSCAGVDVPVDDPGDAIFGIEDFDNQIPRPAARRVVGNGKVQDSVGVGGNNGVTLPWNGPARKMSTESPRPKMAFERRDAKDLFITNPPLKLRTGVLSNLAGRIFRVYWPGTSDCRRGLAIQYRSR